VRSDEKGGEGAELTRSAAGRFLVSGRVDHAAAALLWRSSDQLFADGSDPVVDLSRLSSANSAAIARMGGLSGLLATGEE
jgi:ABC-type transporter Mla MlaB component